MLHSSFHFILLVFCWTSASSVSDPRRLDSDDTDARLQQLENNMAMLQSQTKSNDRKYGAIISNLLSELALVKQDLSASKQEISSLKSEMVSLQWSNNRTSKKFDIVMTDMATSSELSKLEYRIDNVTVTTTYAVEELKNGQNHNYAVLNTLKTSLNHLPIVQKDIHELKNETTVIQHSVASQKNDVKFLYQSVNNLTDLVANLTLDEKSNPKLNVPSLMNRVHALENTQTLLNINCSSMERVVTGSKHVINVMQGNVTVLQSESAIYNKLITTLRNDVVLLKTHSPSRMLLSNLTSSVNINANELGILKRKTSTLQHAVNTLKTNDTSELSQLSSKVDKNTRNVGHLLSSTKGLFTAAMFKATAVRVVKTKLIFSHVELQTGGGYSSGTGIFRAPSTGTYMFTVVTKKILVGAAYTVSLYVGTGVAVSGAMNSRDTLTLNTLVHLEARTQVYVKCPTCSSKNLQTAIFYGIRLH